MATQSSPLTKINKNTFVEGYWSLTPTAKSLYPFPVNSGQVVSKDFIIKLDQILNILFDHLNQNPFSNKSFPLNSEMTSVVRPEADRPRSPERVWMTIRHVQYLGLSNCRLCGKTNGSSEYIIEEGKTKWIIPQGLMHYYQDHRVQPSQEFHDMIMNIDLKN
jgi:hypothetical protein